MSADEARAKFDEIIEIVERIRSWTFDGLQVLPLLQAREALDDLLDWVERGDYEEEYNRAAFSATVSRARFALGLHRKTRAAASIPVNDEPIWIPCEGSGCPLHRPGLLFGICSCCGNSLVIHDEGSNIAWPHKRRDILAMLRRGDFG